ncbi:MAG TPA: hypothetical protein VHD32_16425 [Candidatus Didemnitutus sp.]|nr:hypothetical protein [Candidatus Didemnitutus sp.]
MKSLRWHFGLALLATLAGLHVVGAETPSLEGRWSFELDRSAVGESERWYANLREQRCRLPGTLPGQGIGDDVTVTTAWTGSIFDRSWFTAPRYVPYREPGNIKVPFWLQPDKYYVGKAWFVREFDLPVGWSDKSIRLLLERPHWKTAVWLDGVSLGSRDSLSVPHEYRLSAALAPGRHRLAICVDNTLAPDIGENSHSISDHTQGNWNGIAGRIELIATPATWIDDLQAYPDYQRHRVTVRGHISPTSPAQTIRVRFADEAAGRPVGSAIESTATRDGNFEVDYPVGAEAPSWDEFSPVVHHLTASLDNGDHRTIDFGLREVASVGRELTINGRPMFLRGTLDCAAFPRTGHPPMDVASWRKEFQAIRAHGLNHVRFHSWCPPEAAFQAADEAGLYLQVEVASWPNWSTTLGDGKPVDAWLDAETDRILDAYGSHPSFAFLCACNEPGGDHATAWLARWVTRHRSQDGRRLYTSGAGWPELSENDYQVRAEPRIQHWKEGLASRLNRLPPETVTDYREIVARSVRPVVSHEIGQWCAFPNFDEMSKYTGYLKPRNFEIFRDALAHRHLLPQAADFLRASGKLQALCYKEDIESALRTPEMGGFQLLGLSDFPGQGTALVGVLDAFWEQKGYISPEEFHRFCGATIPLARLPRRVFTDDESLSAEIEVAHFGPTPLSGAKVKWSLRSDEGKVVHEGRIGPVDLRIGHGASIGQVTIPLKNLPAPARYKLVVSVEGTSAANDWDVWVYPSKTPEARPRADVMVTHALDANALAALARGAPVVLFLAPASLRPDPDRPVALGFTSIFWNTAWTNGQAPHTLGILCDPHHPALAGFPTDPWSNWQWWYPIRHAGAMILDDFPAELKPLIQVVPDWHDPHKLALAFEARVGSGRLLVCSIDLDGDSPDPVRRQLRASLLAYSSSAEFRPQVDVSVADVERLVATSSLP